MPDKTSLKPVEFALNFLSSLIAGAFAFWLIYLLQGLVTLYFSYDFNIAAKITMDGVQFSTPFTFPQWTKDAVVTIFLAPPIFFFFSGLLFLVLLGSIKRKSPTLLFFILWMAILFNGASFGTIIEEGVARSGLYRVTEALNLGVVLLVISVSVSIYFLYLTGVIIGKLILLNIDDSWKSSGRLKIKVFIVLLLLPFLINLVIFLIYADLNIGQTIIFTMSVIVILPVLWVVPPKKNNFNIEPAGNFNLLDGVTLILFFIMVILIYISISHGIELPLTFLS